MEFKMRSAKLTKRIERKQLKNNGQKIFEI
jgi:hypothetical protein